MKPSTTAPQSGGSFIKQADGSFLQVEGPAMKAEDRAAGATKRAEMLKAAKKRAQKAAAVKAGQADAAAAPGDAPTTKSAGAPTGGAGKSKE